MEEKKMTIREWQNAYREGKFRPTRSGMCAAGWFDWFCKDSSLVGRLEKLAPVVLGITNDYILDNFYVWFKNNCPVSGPLYDDIRFEPLDESRREKEYFLVVRADKREEFTWVVYTAKDIWESETFKPGFGAPRVNNVIKFINDMKF